MKKYSYGESGEANEWWEGERGWVWERRRWPHADKRVVNFINDYVKCFYFHNMVRRSGREKLFY